MRSTLIFSHISVVMLRKSPTFSAYMGGLCDVTALDAMRSTLVFSHISVAMLR